MKQVHEVSTISDVRSTMDHVMSRFTSIFSELVRLPILGTVLSSRSCGVSSRKVLNLRYLSRT
ncbi:MAG: hypothetical protein DRJ40_10730 [Thermoprotei archaeon]|nr:MAG: hypothetical protein DRJ40_10730 [Thermoprotei archaeon]